MQKTPILISLTIAILLTVYISMFELPTQIEKENFSKYILNFESEDLIELTVKNKDQPTIILNKDGKLWKITKPLVCRANQELINSIANLLPKLTKSNSISKKEQRPLSEYGLESPKLTLTVTYRDIQNGNDKQRTIIFGSATGAKNEVYIKADNDDHVYLMHVQVAIQLAKDINHFRDINLVDQIQENIIGIAVETPEEKWSITKNNLIWQISEPYTWKINQEAIVELLKNFTKLKISRFVENDLSKKDNYGLNQSLVKIKYTNTENQSTTLYIGATRAGSTFVQNTSENFIYAVESTELIKCIPNLQVLKDFELFTTKSPEIVQLDYTHDKNIYNFQKNIKQAWMVNNSTYPLEQQAVSALIEQTAVLVPEYFVDGDINNPEFGLNSKEAITLNIINIKGQKETLKIGQSAKGFVLPSLLKYFPTIEAAKKYVAVNKLKEEDIQELKDQHFAIYNNYTQIFTIDSALIEKLKWPLIKFEPLEFPEININAIYTIDRTINGKSEHFQRFGSNVNWEITSPEKAKLNDKEVALFIFTICFFKAEEWVKANFKVEEFKDYGLDSPMIQIEATFNELSDTIKTGQYKYLISKKINGKYYGCIYVNINKQDYVLVPKLFTVPEKTVTERFLKKLY